MSSWKLLQLGSETRPWINGLMGGGNGRVGLGELSLGSGPVQLAHRSLTILTAAICNRTSGVGWEDWSFFQILVYNVHCVKHDFAYIISLGVFLLYLYYLYFKVSLSFSLCVCVFVFCAGFACMHLCVSCSCAHEGKKRVWDLLELKLQTVVSNNMGPGDPNWVEEKPSAPYYS